MNPNEQIAKEILEEKLGFRDVRKSGGKAGSPDLSGFDRDGKPCRIEVKGVTGELDEKDDRPTATLKRHQMHVLAELQAAGNRCFVMYVDQHQRFFLFELAGYNRQPKYGLRALAYRYDRDHIGTKA